jgi:hypothetical protein
LSPLFDPASLPPIESISAETDIRAFLAPGVPPELARAALRRAWAADPKIRDFVGLADYDWDFNAPGSMAGFGPLEMTEGLRERRSDHWPAARCKAGRRGRREFRSFGASGFGWRNRRERVHSAHAGAGGGWGVIRRRSAIRRLRLGKARRMRPKSHN